MASSTTLMSLALLKVDIDTRGADYIDYLRPFVVETLRTHRPSPLQDAVVSQHILRDFGLKIPNAAVQLVLRRLAKIGILRKEHGTYEIVAEIPDTSFTELQAVAQRRIETLLRQLREYANRSLSLNWTDEDSIKAVVLYLSEFAVECLRTYIYNTTLPDIPPRSDKDIRVVHAFVRDEVQHFADGFENFITLVKGHMLANALLCPDVQSLQQKFEKVTFYLDTPLVLRALGMSAHASSSAATELLQLLRALRAHLAVFEHTKTEILRVLKSAEDNFHRPDNAAPLIRELKQQGKGASDIALMRSQIDRRLQSLGINVKRTPAHVKDFQIDETVLEDVIEEEIAYHNPQARVHDVDCIRSIFTLRKGMAPVRLEDAVAVFVTTNTPLARKAFEYGRQYEHSREISSVITDFSLANIAWLKAPMAAPDLPEREVIAACYAALQPPAELWKKYLGEVDRLRQNNLINETDLVFLRNDSLAKEELMNLTLGDATALTAETVPEILERIKSEVLAEERARTDKLAKELADLRAQKATQIKKAYAYSEKTGTFIATAIGCALILAAVLASGLIPDDWLAGVYYPRVVAPLGALIIVGTIAGLVDLICGWSILDCFRTLRSISSRVALKAYSNIMGIAIE